MHPATIESTPPPFLHPQSGALFGVDARLALLIFGLLAVVAGYVAYGRIALAKTAALVADIENIDQALQAYQTDMGTFFLFTLVKEEGDSGATDLEALWDKSRVLEGFQHLWNGPYLHRTSRKHRDYGMYTVFYGQGDRQSTCTLDSDCYVWLALSKVPQATWREINRALDESAGKTPEPAGDATTLGRVQAVEATDPLTLIYRSVAR